MPSDLESSRVWWGDKIFLERNFDHLTTVLAGMVHLRLNEKESNPNPLVNFITPLPGIQDSDDARQLLRALAAQVRPVMKRHGFTVNSLEEVSVIHKLKFIFC